MTRRRDTRRTGRTTALMLLGLLLLAGCSCYADEPTIDGMKRPDALAEIQKLDCEASQMDGVLTILARPTFDDADLAALPGLAKPELFKEIARLQLAGSEVTIQGLAFLDRVAPIRELDLCRLGLADEALSYVVPLGPDLTDLLLDENTLSDAGLDDLQGFARLEYVSLIDNPQITDAGVAALQARLAVANPDVEIFH